jgi:hypothetical protein
MGETDTTAASWWNAYGALVISVGTGFAYLVGYSTLSVFASGLGVSSSDLGLDFRDYIVIAGLNIVVWAMAFGVVLVIRKIEGRILPQATGLLRLVRFVVTLPFGVAAFTLIAVMAGLTAEGSLIALVAGSLFVGATDPHPAIGARPATSPPAWTQNVVWRLMGNTRTLTACVALLASVTAGFAGAVAWADHLQRAAETGERPSRGPIAIALVINPERGIVKANGQTACVLRVTDSVLLSREATAVVSDVEAFSTSRCDLDRSAFD